jgi:GntR family transcriptional regulator
MRRALISLEGMGYLSRKPGRGTLVASASGRSAPAAVLPAPVLLSAAGQPIALNPFRARSGHRSASPQEADLMGSARLSYLERSLKSGSTRAAIDEIAVPDNLIADLTEDAPVGLTACLEAHGLSPASIRAEAHAEMTDMALSVALSVDRHTALLCVTFTAFDEAGAAMARQSMKVAVPGARLSFA